MFESLTESLRLWNKSNDDRAKLQHTYLTVAIVLVVVAGLISLLDAAMGQDILGFALLAGGVLIINAIVWALLQSFILARISSSPRRTAPATTRATSTRTPKK